ncbi:sigma-70 family RNA polymerase sigma factor [Sporomusa acidovorans]|uniref:RNA polymerase sigma factor SigS n=1 Tax=Sporomusa acidovorans (strain ATCC 49682 / DSM 3132 / Mol) TaxID=1123286 RepID=A0ABZ3JAY6_SPOA4|nr:sigma-70 family RNA polymerase sigma factor [Sporomusa acidovorans]OZC22703.1 RNA polymerase sigma-H factor [Sporomusa acidovorans DSM 3132]SDE79262.1 RNA polymerase sporulation-specific sigma factor [Sporomusa acidovorans]
MLESCFYNDGSVNNEEFERIARQYHKVILRYVKVYYLPGGDYRDMYQWGLIGLYKAVCHYDEERGKSFRLMAELNIKNTIKSAVTMHNRKKHYFLNEAISLNVMHDSSGITLDSVLIDGTQSDPAALIIEEETVRNINVELSNILSRLEKRVLDLYIAGYKQREIAKKLDLQEKVIDNAIQRARNKMAFRMKDSSGYCRKNGRHTKSSMASNKQCTSMA